MATKKVLSGHKRIGKRFVPPMMQIGPMRATSFVNDMLPELIWLGLINERVGYVRGARLFEQIIAAAADVVKADSPGNYALSSRYASLSASDKGALVDSLSRRALISPLRDYLAPLVILYNECPLGFIGPPGTPPSKPELIASMKHCIERHIDRYETPGIVLHGMMLLSRLTTKTIRVANNVSLPDLNAVVEDPESAGAMRAASFMRANALAEFAMLQPDNTWAISFWNTGFELDQCEFPVSQDE